MQSLMRKFNRIAAGLQNPAFSSTKVSKHTPYAKAEIPGHRTNRGGKKIVSE